MGVGKAQRSFIWRSGIAHLGYSSGIEWRINTLRLAHSALAFIDPASSEAWTVRNLCTNSCRRRPGRPTL
jgi:hypothetical protein